MKKLALLATVALAGCGGEPEKGPGGLHEGDQIQLVQRGLGYWTVVGFEGNRLDISTGNLRRSIDLMTIGGEGIRIYNCPH